MEEDTTEDGSGEEEECELSDHVEEDEWSNYITTAKGMTKHSVHLVAALHSLVERALI